MTNSRLTYLGPVKTPGKNKSRADQARNLIARVPALFLVIVLLPTVSAAIYFFLIASPRYVSEARFVVRSPAQEQPSSLGVALQGVGLSPATTDSFAVHEYIRSRDGLRALMTEHDVMGMYERNGVDVFSRPISPLVRRRTFDDFYAGLQRYVKVGYDSTTGISTLRVQAFSPKEAQDLANGYLDAGERLVNRLNVRAAANAVAEAEQGVADAASRMSRAQVALTEFRNREGSLDPTRSAIAGAEMVGALNLRLAELRAERAQLVAEAPSSPQLASIDNRIRALEGQTQLELRRQAGASSSLASKIGSYETLLLEREMSDKNLMLANAALENARQDRRRQALYLERVVEPAAAERSDEPRRLRSVLAILLSCLVAYGTLWLIMAGLRESKQGHD